MRRQGERLHSTRELEGQDACNDRNNLAATHHTSCPAHAIIAPLSEHSAGGGTTNRRPASSATACNAADVMVGGAATSLHVSVSHAVQGKERQRDNSKRSMSQPSVCGGCMKCSMAPAEMPARGCCRRRLRRRSLTCGGRACSRWLAYSAALIVSRYKSSTVRVPAAVAYQPVRCHSNHPLSVQKR